MNNKFMTGAEFARFTGVSRAAITTATKEGRLHRDPITKKYDPNHSVNQAFIDKNRIKTLPGEILDGEPKDLTTFTPDEVPGSLQDLYRQKLQIDIDYKAAQKRKLDLQHEIQKRNLIPSELIGIFLGYFASGISTNFLTIAGKAARGDTRLKERIDALIKKAVIKTIENASQELRKESELIIQKMGGKVES